MILGPQIFHGSGSGECFNPSDTRTAGAVPEGHEGTDVPCLTHVRAAAQFQRIGVAVRAFTGALSRAHGNHADLVAVFLTKERLSAERARIVRRHNPGLNGGVLADICVHFGLNCCELVAGQCLGVAEIKPQTVRRVQGPALCDVIAQSLAQRLVQQVRCRVVGPDGCAACVIHFEHRGLAGADCAADDLADVQEHTSGFARIRDLGHPIRCGDGAAVTNLAAAFGVERRLVQSDLDAVPGARAFCFGAFRHNGNDLALSCFGVIAQEISGPVFVGHIKPDGGISGLTRSGPCGACLGLLFGHSGVKPVCIHRAPFFAQGVLGQIKREPIGVIKPESGSTRQVSTFRQAGQFVVQ